MTNTDIIPTTTDTDPRPLFRRAAAVGHEVLAAVTADQLHRPTPCAQFDVDHLSAHVLAVVNRIGVLGAGGDFFSTPQSIDDIALADRADAYASFAAVADEAWSADDALDRMLALPWATLPGRVTLLIYLNEIIVHTWDLAVATGRAPQWDDEILEVAYAAIQRGLPADGRSVTGDGSDGGSPFAPVVDVAGDAPLIDRLVAWNGRRP
jgi:uncharacterized protein (TIGR03086 family)